MDTPTIEAVQQARSAAQKAATDVYKKNIGAAIRDGIAPLIKSPTPIILANAAFDVYAVCVMGLVIEDFMMLVGPKKGIEMLRQAEMAATIVGADSHAHLQTHIAVAKAKSTGSTA